MEHVFSPPLRKTSAEQHKETSPFYAHTNNNTENGYSFYEKIKLQGTKY